MTVTDKTPGLMESVLAIVRYAHRRDALIGPTITGRVQWQQPYDQLQLWVLAQGTGIPSAGIGPYQVESDLEAFAELRTCARYPTDRRLAMTPEEKFATNTAKALDMVQRAMNPIVRIGQGDSEQVWTGGPAMEKSPDAKAAECVEAFKPLADAAEQVLRAEAPPWSLPLLVTRGRHLLGQNAYSATLSDGTHTWPVRTAIDCWWAWKRPDMKAVVVGNVGDVFWLDFVEPDGVVVAPSPAYAPLYWASRGAFVLPTH